MDELTAIQLIRFVLQFVLAPLLLHTALSAAFHYHYDLFKETGYVVSSTNPSEDNLLVWGNDNVVLFFLASSLVLGGYLGYLFGWAVGIISPVIGLALGKMLVEHVLSDNFSVSLLRLHRRISAALLLVVLYNLWSIWPS